MKVCMSWAKGFVSEGRAREDGVQKVAPLARSSTRAVNLSSPQFKVWAREVAACVSELDSPREVRRRYGLASRFIWTMKQVLSFAS
jgi:hypothetical protein